MKILENTCSEKCFSILVLVKLKTLNLQLFRNIWTWLQVFQVICLYRKKGFKGFKVHLKEKNNNFENQCILFHSRYIDIHFQPLQFVRSPEQYSTFYKHKESSDKERMLPSAIDGNYWVRVHNGKCSASTWK